MNLQSVFAANAAKLRDLHDAIHSTLRRRDESPACRAAWEESCRRFHAEYDSLAFPGGLGRAFSELEAGNPTTIEMAVQFLETDPYFYRSGYHKVDFIKHLCKSDLLEQQKKRLQQVVLSQICDRDKREFRAYCRLARAVTDSAFEKQIAEMASPSSGTIPRHAQWVLNYLNQPKAAARIEG